MIISVAMNARGIQSVEGRVCIVLDVLRASSTMLAMFEAGARELRLAATPEDALDVAGNNRSDFWVCGERAALKVDGFDFGNSPAEVADANLAGRDVVYVTSNGTGALRAVADAPLVLVGSPRNEVAVVRQAMRAAQEHSWNIQIVCAGDNGGFGISLEDAFVAGMLVDRFAKLSPRRVTPEEARGEAFLVGLDDSAILAHRLFGSYLGPRQTHATSETMLAMFAESRSGRDLPSKGYGPDLDYCSEIDVTTVVPRLESRDGRLVVVSQGQGDPRDAD